MKNLVQILFYCSTTLLLLIISSTAKSVPIGVGNVLVSSDERLYEYTTSGTLVQTIAIPYPGGAHPISESARDIAYNDTGDVYVYNGTFDPFLSTLDTGSNTWDHRTFSGWSTVNNGSYGGIDVTNNYAFVTDMRTFGDGGADEARGVVRFDLTNSSATRFATSLEPIDLTVGLNGLLYVLYPGGSPEGRFIDVFDPVTMSLVDQISLASIFGHTGHRSIAVDINGDLFIADWDGEVHHVDNSGILIDTILPTCDRFGFDVNCQFNDIDISEFGELALGTRFGEIFLTDTNFSTITTFDLDQNSDAFVEFVHSTISEPSIISLFGIASLLLLAIYRRENI